MAKAWRRRRPDEGKDCKACGSPLTPDDCTSFGRRCRACYNKWQRDNTRSNPRTRRARLKATLKYHYGIGIEVWDRLLEEQSGLCAICGGGPEGSRGDRLHVDHCHETGKVRGLLCGGCNLMIGHGKNRPETLRLGASYLEAHGLQTLPSS